MCEETVDEVELVPVVELELDPEPAVRIDPDRESSFADEGFRPPASALRPVCVSVLGKR